MNEKPKPLNRMAILATVVAAVVGSIGGRMIVEQLTGQDDKKSEFDKVLIESANEFNRNLPMMVDQNTRLDSTAALPGRQFLYKYTLVGVDPAKIDKEKYIEWKRPELLNQYKTTPQMKDFRENQVKLAYLYQMEDGTLFAEITVSPEDF